MTTTVRISWSRQFDNEKMWNEVCAWAIEKFGLPGEKFHTCVNVNYMEFVFNSEYDALMMSLRWNAPIINNQELATEFVGSKINGL